MLQIEGSYPHSLNAQTVEPQMVHLAEVLAS